MEELVSQIEDREKDLFEFIEGEVFKSIRMRCQWRLTNVIFKEQQKKEREKIDIYSKEVMRWLEKNTPIHYEFSRSHPLSMVTNECNFVYYQSQFDEYHSDNSNLLNNGFFVCLTYKNFENAGFSRDFTKRVVEKYISLGEIKRIRDFGGYIYGLTELDRLFPYIEYSREAVELNQRGLVQAPYMNWIFDAYSGEDLQKKFNLILKEYAYKLPCEREEQQTSLRIKAICCQDHTWQ